MNNIKITKLFALSMTLVLVCTSLSFVNAETLQEKKQNIENQIEANKQKISATESQVTEYLEQVDELNNQIAEYTNNLSVLQEKVSEVNKKIEEYEDNLQNSSQRFSSAEDLYAVDYVRFMKMVCQV